MDMLDKRVYTTLGASFLICMVVILIGAGCGPNPNKRYEITQVSAITNTMYKCSGLLIGRNKTTLATFLYIREHHVGDNIWINFQGDFTVERVEVITNITYKLNFENKNTKYSQYQYEVGDYVDHLTERIK